MPTDSIALVRPMPSTPVTAMASTIGGKGQQRVDEAADDLVEPAADEADDQPDRHAEHDRDADGEQRSIKRVRGAPDQPAQHVAAEIVGAEPVRGAWRQQQIFATFCSIGE